MSTFYCRLRNYRHEVKPVVSYPTQKKNEPVKYEKNQEKRLQCKWAASPGIRLKLN